MSDVFIEQLVKRQKDSKQRMLRSLIVAGMALLALLPVVLFFFQLLQFFSIGLVVMCGGCWLLITLHKRTYLEHEYIFTNGDLDVDKIMGKMARKRVLTVNVRNFEILAPYTKDYASEYNSQSIQVRLDFSSGLEQNRRCFAIFSGKDSQRTLMIFEPNEKVVDAMKPYTRGKMKGL